MNNILHVTDNEISWITEWSIDMEKGEDYIVQPIDLSIFSLPYDENDVRNVQHTTDDEECDEWNHFCQTVKAADSVAVWTSGDNINSFLNRNFVCRIFEGDIYKIPINKEEETVDWHQRMIMLTPEQKSAYAKEWADLCANQTNLRKLIDGRIENMPDTYCDEEILSIINAGNSIISLDECVKSCPIIPSSFLLWRLCELAKNGSIYIGTEERKYELMDIEKMSEYFHSGTRNWDIEERHYCAPLSYEYPTISDFVEAKVKSILNDETIPLSCAGTYLGAFAKHVFSMIHLLEDEQDKRIATNRILETLDDLSLPDDCVLDTIKIGDKYNSFSEIYVRNENEESFDGFVDDYNVPRVKLLEAIKLPFNAHSIWQAFVLSRSNGFLSHSGAAYRNKMILDYHDFERLPVDCMKYAHSEWYPKIYCGDRYAVLSYMFFSDHKGLMQVYQLVRKENHKIYLFRECSQNILVPYKTSIVF